MKQLQDWSCDFKIDSSTALTVGQKFAMLCYGQTDLDTRIKPKLSFNSDDEAYKLVILRHKYKSPNELFVSLTSWQTGKHSFRDIQMTLDSDYILLKPPSFVVKSVLKNKEQMNPPPGPILKKPPDFLWYLLVILLFSAGLYLLKIYKKSRKIDRGLLRLNSFKTSLSPFYEFQKQIRATKKMVEKPLQPEELKQICTEFYKNLVVYVSLQINAPLFVMTEKEVNNSLNKKITNPKLIKDYFYLTRELKKTAIEIDGSSDIKNLQRDFEDLLDESNFVSQKLNKYFIGALRL